MRNKVNPSRARTFAHFFHSVSVLNLSGSDSCDSDAAESTADEKNPWCACCGLPLKRGYLRSRVKRRVPAGAAIGRARDAAATLQAGRVLQRA
jgi:hypothetical protein